MSNSTDSPDGEAFRDVSDEYLVIWTSEFQNKPDQPPFVDQNWIQSQAQKITRGAIVLRDNPTDLRPEGLPRKLALTLAEKDKLFVVLIVGGPPLLPMNDSHEDDNALAYGVAEGEPDGLWLLVRATEAGAPYWHAFLRYHNPAAEIAFMRDDERASGFWLPRTLPIDEAQRR